MQLNSEAFGLSKAVHPPSTPPLGPALSCPDVSSVQQRSLTGLKTRQHYYAQHMTVW